MNLSIFRAAARNYRLKNAGFGESLKPICCEWHNHRIPKIARDALSNKTKPPSHRRACRGDLEARARCPTQHANFFARKNCAGNVKSQLKSAKPACNVSVNARIKLNSQIARDARAIKPNLQVAAVLVAATWKPLKEPPPKRKFFRQKNLRETHQVNLYSQS